MKIQKKELDIFEEEELAYCEEDVRIIEEIYKNMNDRYSEYPYDAGAINRYINVELVNRDVNKFTNFLFDILDEHGYFMRILEQVGNRLAISVTDGKWLKEYYFNYENGITTDILIRLFILFNDVNIRFTEQLYKEKIIPLLTFNYEGLSKLDGVVCYLENVESDYDEYERVENEEDNEDDE